MPELTPDKLRELTRKWLEGTLTPDESKLLDNWYNRETPDQVEWSSGDIDEYALKERLFNNISKGMKPEAKVVSLRSNIWLRGAVAASVLLTLSTLGYFLLHKQHPKQETVQLIKNDIAPGHNQATLTLANGKKIILTKGLTGTLAKQGQTTINVTQNNITYNANKTNEQISYNTLTTARGEQSPYPLVLADGTKVWLNAESSITFPTAFNKRERIVKITGEAFFEVVHNSKQPFIVEVKGQAIRDVGTEFNVNAYDDEPIVRTTLVQGSIAIAYNNHTELLKPGQEADLANNTLMVKTGDIEEAVAWKNNLFHFTGVDLKTVMRQFSRWYDVNVTYLGEIPDHEFAGEMSRNVKASEVFEALGRYGLTFKIDGKNVIVSRTTEKPKDN